MTLKQTVSKILRKNVSARRAQLFANEEYGVLVAYIKAQVVSDILDFRAKKTKTKEYQELNKVFTSKDKEKHYLQQKKLNKLKREQK